MMFQVMGKAPQRPLELWRILQEISTNKSVMFLDVSDTTNDSAVFIATNSPGGQVVTDESLAAGSPKPTGEATDATLALATSSPDSSSEAVGSTFTLATGSLEPTSGAMDSTFDPGTDSSGATGPPLIPSTGSQDLSKGTSELSVSMVTSSLKTPKRIFVLPTALVERSTTTSFKDSTKISRSSPNPNKGVKDTLIPVIVTLLVVLVLVFLLLLWRQRQKRHTGVLTLNGATKRNGVDAWAGRAPVLVSGEEVLTVTVADTQNDKGSEIPQEEVCGRRPTLTTFFSRRKSCQGSVALEELGPGAAPGLKPEEESLIDAGDSAGDTMEAPTFDGLEAGGGEPQSSCE
ncbi:leukosialin [Suncus etruscus]|uniref:leukosialin n=1 Tax=Suncus etruscus TaxID=109475 RepID=UPI00210F8742|nr:leukosialin [Suncus etruscus]